MSGSWANACGQPGHSFQLSYSESHRWNRNTATPSYGCDFSQLRYREYRQEEVLKNRAEKAELDPSSQFKEVDIDGITP